MISEGVLDEKRFFPLTDGEKRDLAKRFR